MIEVTVPLPVLLYETTVCTLETGVPLRERPLIVLAVQLHFFSPKMTKMAIPIPKNASTPTTIPAMAPPLLQVQKKFGDRLQYNRSYEIRRLDGMVNNLPIKSTFNFLNLIILATNYH